MALNRQKGKRVEWLAYHEIVRPGENVKQAGIVSCKIELAEYLDIEINNQLEIPDRIFKVKAHKRSKSRLGGNQTGSSEVAEHDRQRSQKKGNRGGKTVQLITTKVITDSQNQSNSEPTHRVSFNFPGWSSTIDISDFLATVISSEKRSGSTAKIDNYFVLPSGGHYAIMAKERAEALSETQGGIIVPATPQAVQAILDKIASNAPANP